MSSEVVSEIFHVDEEEELVFEPWRRCLRALRDSLSNILSESANLFLYNISFDFFNSSVVGDIWPFSLNVWVAIKCKFALSGPLSLPVN